MTYCSIRLHPDSHCLSLTLLSLILPLSLFFLYYLSVPMFLSHLSPFLSISLSLIFFLSVLLSPHATGSFILACNHQAKKLMNKNIQFLLPSFFIGLFHLFKQITNFTDCNEKTIRVGPTMFCLFLLPHSFKKPIALTCLTQGLQLLLRYFFNYIT